MVPIVIIKLFVVAVFISTSSGQNITTQTTTTSDPQCMDMVANCDVYTKAACNPPYQSWAIKNCRKFCDLCGTTIAASTHAPCVDLVNTCEQHGKSVCQGIFLPWAQMNCRKYCNICGYCASRPCQNKGLCIDGATGYACTCPPGFVGKNCEIELFNTMTTTAAPNCVDGTIVRCSDSHVCMTPELAKYCPLTCKICSPCVDSPLVNCNKAVCGTDPVLSGYCPATCGTCVGVPLLGKSIATVPGV